VYRRRRHRLALGWLHAWNTGCRGEGTGKRKSEFKQKSARIILTGRGQKRASKPVCSTVHRGCTVRFCTVVYLDEALDQPEGAGGRGRDGVELGVEGGRAHEMRRHQAVELHPLQRNKKRKRRHR